MPERRDDRPPSEWQKFRAQPIGVQAAVWAIVGLLAIGGLGALFGSDPAGDGASRAATAEPRDETDRAEAAAREAAVARVAARRKAARERRAAARRAAIRARRAAQRRRAARERRRREAVRRAVERREAERLEAERLAREQAEAERLAQEEAQAGCDANYSGCVPAGVSDVDCAGGSGDGPEYTGPVQVIGTDVYGLDSDGDGMACE